MQLKVTKDTKYTDISHYLTLLTDEQINYLLSEINFDFGKMNIADFCEIIESEKGLIEAVKKRAFERNNAFDFFTWIYGFPKFIEFFGRELKKFEAPENLTVKSASANLPKMTITENILTFLQSFFQSESFSVVENLTVNDYFLARKVAGVRDIFEYNLDNYYKWKSKMKK